MRYMVRKIDQKTIVRELSILFLQARGGKNKVLEWIVKFDMIQLNSSTSSFACSRQSIVTKRKFRPKNSLFSLHPDPIRPFDKFTIFGFFIKKR